MQTHVRKAEIRYTEIVRLVRLGIGEDVPLEKGLHLKKMKVLDDENGFYAILHIRKFDE